MSFGFGILVGIAAVWAVTVTAAVIGEVVPVIRDKWKRRRKRGQRAQRGRAEPGR